MSNILEFKRPAPKKPRKQSSLCRHNHHKWKVVKENQFDTRQGKLVTVEECERCGKRRNKLT